jgi:hypothetical protein
MKPFLQLRTFVAIAWSAAYGTGLLPAAQIVQAEYYLGTDPGPGNGAAISLTDVGSLAAALQSATIPVALPPGTHELGVRVKDDAGRWSNPLLRRFTVQPEDFELAGGLDPNGPADQGRIDYKTGFATGVSAEYSVAAGMGTGTWQSLGIQDSDTLAASHAVKSISLTGRTPGTYTVAVRTRDGESGWSNPVLRRFTVMSAALVQQTEDEVLAGNPLPIETPQTQVWRISLQGGCPEPLYRITIAGHTVELEGRPGETVQSLLARLQQAIQGDPWVSPYMSAVVIGTAIEIRALENGAQASDWLQVTDNLRAQITRMGNLGTEQRKFAAAEYFTDVDPGEGNGVPIPLVTEVNGNGATLAQTEVTIAQLRAGGHRVAIRYKNVTNRWGNPVYRGFNSYLLSGTQDTTPPVITLTGGTGMNLPYGGTFVEPGYTASDETDGNLTASVVVSGSVNPQVPGPQIIRYQVADLAGNLALVERTVTVVETGMPVITGTADFSYLTPPGTTDIFRGLSASDPETGSLSHLIRLASGAVDWFSSGQYELVFEVSDAAGNTSTFTRRITLGENAVFYPDYESWITAYAQGWNAPEEWLLSNADADQDGQTNAMEWMADSDPFDKNSKLQLGFTSSTTTLHFRWCGRTRNRYWIESTTNMSVWQPYTEKVNTDAGSSFALDVPMEPTQKPRWFFRLASEPRQPVFTP